MRTEDFVFPGASDLMPLETPLLRVSRPVAACQRCRTAKIKCDGKLPACTACERSGRADQCSSANSQFAPGKERSYVATLEAKVEKLELKIAAARKRRQSSIVMQEAGLSPISRRTSVESNEKPRDQRARFRKELHDIDELVSDFGFLTVNANARDYHYGFTFAMSYGKLVLSAASKEPLPTGMKKELPPRFSASSCIRLYVENFLTVLPIVEEASLYASLDAVYHDGQNMATSMDLWTVRMVLAIASATLSQQRGDTHYSDAVGHICAAIEVADEVLHPGAIWSIQAMLLLVQYSMLDPAHFDSWQLVGAASRAMIDLGMHQEPSKSSNTRKAKLELRRRVYQCVYALDRLTSIVQTRALSFSDDSANVSLPHCMKPSSPSTASPGADMWSRSSDVSLANIRLRQLQSSWYSALFQSGRTPWQDPYNYIWKEYQAMSDWFAKLPPRTAPQARDYFELELLFSYVYILSPSPRCPQISEHAQRLIVEHCTTYANKVLLLITRPTDVKNPSPFTFYDAIRVYMTARHFVDVLSSNLDVLLQDPRSPSGFNSVSGSTLDTEVDPLSSLVGTIAPPALPTPTYGESYTNVVSRFIDTINEFISILSTFGIRFGYVSGVSWRDRFQQESQSLLGRLQHRLQQRAASDSSSFPFWNAGGPVTPQSNLSPSPRRSTGFYPSPATTQYSPRYVPQEPEGSPMNSAWSLSSAQQEGSSIASANFGSDIQDFSNAPMMAAPNVHNEFGIGSMAAWETIPGGPLNSRFS